MCVCVCVSEEKTKQEEKLINNKVKKRKIAK